MLARKGWTVRVDPDLELFLVAAPAIDLGHAGHRPQLRLDHPVVQGTQFREHADPLFLRQCGEVVALVGDGIVEHLPEAGRDGAETGPLDARRHLDRGEPLVDQLTGEVNIRPVLEGDYHL